MKKSKPSKQAGNLTKRESNKGDYKGLNPPEEKKDTNPLNQKKKGYIAAKKLTQVKGIKYPHTDRAYIVPDNVDEISYVRGMELAALERKLSDKAKKAAKKSLDARKETSTNWKESFLKFRADYLQRNQKLDNTIPESQIINSFREQNPKAPKESTLYNYLSKK